MAKKNRDVAAALIENQPKKIFAYAGDSLKQARAREAIDIIAEQLNGAFTLSDYKSKDDFYERRDDKRAVLHLRSGENGEHDYEVTYVMPTRKCYISIGLVADSNRALGILTIWNNHEGKWRLDVLRVGIMKLSRLDAVDWYYRALQLHTATTVADASIAAHVFNVLIAPFGPGFVYCNAEQMKSSMEGIILDAERSFSFPIALHSVRTTPVIVGLGGELYKGKICPVIRYVSAVPPDDSIAYRREADSLNAHIGEVFTDIDHNNRVSLYRGYLRRSDDTLSEIRTLPIPSAAPWTY